MDLVETKGRRFLISRQQKKLAPTLVFLHGTGGAIEWVDSEIHLAAFCYSLGMQVVYPQGLPLNLNREPGFLSNPYRWNDGSTLVNDPLHTTTDDVAFLDVLFSLLISEERADPSRLYLAGFSNGAGMTYRYASEGMHHLAGIAPIAGHCWVQPARLKKPLSTISLLGDCDPLIPLNGGPVLLPWGQRIVERQPMEWSWAKWAIANSCSETPISIIDHMGITINDYPGPESEFRTMIIPGLGHHWPGGAGQLNPRIGGPKSSPVRANNILAKFFKWGES